MKSNVLLDISNLRVEFRTHYGTVRAVNGISYKLRQGETLGILGESGSGKSVSSLAIMGLIRPPGVVRAESLRFKDIDLLNASESAFQNIRGNQIAMIFQDPGISLNPSLTVGHQIMEMYTKKKGISRSEARKKTIEIMENVRIPFAKQRIGEYPYQLSGGLQQRIMIAIAISLNPEILIADEPTSSLDVTIQKQINRLLINLQKETGMAIIYISHDLGVLAETVEKCIVMYLGKVLETGSTADVFMKPAHPYTLGLLNSLPGIRTEAKLKPIKGSTPILTKEPVGCVFYPRCSFRRAKCKTSTPELQSVSVGRKSACFYYKDIYGKG